MTQPRVLIIDDDAQVARSLAAALRRQCEVTVFTSSVEACRALTSPGTDYDVIFCDLTMPWIDGIELHRRVQRFDATVAERFVFLTGDIGPHVDALVAAGAEVLAKPFELAEVRALIPATARSSVSRSA